MSYKINDLINIYNSEIEFYTENLKDDSNKRSVKAIITIYNIVIEDLKKVKEE